MARISAGMDFGQATVQPTRAPVVDVSPGLGAVADSLNRIGAQRQAEGEHLQRAQDAEAKQAAREAQHLREQADAAVAQSRLYALRDGLKVKAKDLQDGVLAGSVDKTTALKTWQDEAAKVVEAGLDGVPDAHKQQLQLDSQNTVRDFGMALGDTVKLRDKQDMRSAIDQTMEYAGRLAITEPDKARLIVKSTLGAIGLPSGLAPADITRMEQAHVEGAAYTRAFTAVHAAKLDNKALSVVEQAIAKNPDLDSQKQAQLLAQVDNFRVMNETRAINAARHAEVLAAAAQRKSSAALDRLGLWAMKGATPDPNMNAALFKDLLPADLAAYRSLAADIPARVAVATLPLQTQTQELDALKARFLQAASQPLEIEIKRREQVLAEARKDYADEPLRAANERGVITSPLRPLNTASMDTIAAGLVERAGQAQEAAAITKLPVSPLLAEEAGRLGGILQALPIADRGRRIAQMAELLPAPMMLALAQQIGGEDKGAKRALSLEMQFGVDKTASGRYRSELVARGAQAIKDKSIKEDTAAEFGLRAQIAKEVGDSLPARWREDAIDAARLMYLGQQAESGNPSVKGVVALAAGGPIVEHNGRRIPLMAGLDEDKFKDKLKAYPAAALASQAPGGAVVLPGGRQIAVADFLAGLPEAQLEPVAPGRYGVRAGSGIVMGPAGRPIIIEVR